MSGLLIAGAEVRTHPFLHATVEEVFTRDIAAEFRDELESMRNWHLHRGGFFEQHERDLLREAPERLGALLSPELLEAVRGWLAETMMTTFEDRTKVIAHRLTVGQGIGLHNDSPDDEDETHRFVIHFGREYEDEQGGHLVLFNGPDLDAVGRVLRPIHNTGMAFAASDDSFHAVVPVRHGTRRSVVFSFWESPASRSLAASDRVAHSGGSLRQHFDGVGVLLRTWQAPESVIAAGRLHSVYGTGRFNDATGEPDTVSRQRVSAAIGPQAERLVWLYAVSSRESRVESLLGGCLRRHDDGQELSATTWERTALMQIDLADTIEQLPRVPVSAEELIDEWNMFSTVADHLPAAGMATLRTAIQERS